MFLSLCTRLCMMLFNSTFGRSINKNVLPMSQMSSGVYSSPIFLLHICGKYNRVTPRLVPCPLQICLITTCNRTPTSSWTTCWTQWLTSCRRRRSRRSRTDAWRTTAPPSPLRTRWRTRQNPRGFTTSFKERWPMRRAVSTVKRWVCTSLACRVWFEVLFMLW